jgi:ATP-dependent DNA helicase DinG
MLLFERFVLRGGTPHAEESLPLPEPDISRPLATQRSRIESFFLNLAGTAGFHYSDIRALPKIKEWQTAWKYFEKSDLLDLRLLLSIFFPTLSAESLPDLARAFRLSNDLDDAASLGALTEIVESKARGLARGQLRLLKKQAAGLTSPLSSWINALKPSATATEFDTDSTCFTNLDRYNALTDGRTLTPEAATDLLADPELGAKSIDGFELRKGQSRYATAVRRALMSDSVLLAEAATGTGKSIGYLLPTVAVAQATESRAVLVTRTKSLQGQLFTSDLRMIRKLLPPGFKVALLKGIANYLCLLRYKSLPGEGQFDADEATAATRMALIIWEKETTSGDLSEVTLLSSSAADSLATELAVDERGCLGQNCPYYRECYAFRARRRAQQSDLVITNYALLLADLGSNSHILGRFAYAVLDEAHRFEGEAIRAFSVQISPAWLTRLLSYHAADKTIQLLRLLTRGDEDDLLAELADLTDKLEPFVALFAEKLGSALQSRPGSQRERIRFQPGDEVSLLIRDLWQAYEQEFKALRKLIERLLPEFGSPEESELRAEAAETRRRASQLAEAIGALRALAEEDGSKLVMWGSSTSAGNAVLTGAPLHVGKLLADRFYPNYRSLILTSATLDSEDEFAWIGDRLGLSDNEDLTVARLKQTSPFPLSEQLKVSVAAFLPAPNSADYPRRLAELLVRLRQAIRMSTLVLCTSHQMIGDLEKALKQAGVMPGQLLVQKARTPAARLLDRFRSSPGAMLIGTESFWEGVDLPDDTLRLLVLTRLPFPVPDDPLEQVKGEQAEAKGLNPFVTVSLPTAVLKYRQALGRVIRSASDWGAVVVTDSRMSRKRYGAIFHDATGVEVDTYENPSLLCRDISEWLYQLVGDGR